MLNILIFLLLILSIHHGQNINRHYFLSSANVSSIIGVAMKTRKKRKTYSPDFKKEIAETVLSCSETYSAIARQYGVTNHQVARWAKEYLNQDTLWVQELNAHFRNDSKEETMAEHIEKEGTASNGLQSFNELIPHEESDRFSVDVSLPSGTKVSISNLTTDQLQAVLKICQ